MVLMGMGYALIGEQTAVSRQHTPNPIQPKSNPEKPKPHTTRDPNF
jgi:hypothetical protein